MLNRIGDFVHYIDNNICYVVCYCYSNKRSVVDFFQGGGKTV